MTNDPLRPSLLPPGIAISAVGVGMAWTGLRLGNETLALCGLVLVSTALVAWLTSRHLRSSLAAGRFHHPRVFEEGICHVQLRVENRGRLPLLGIELRDAFPPGDIYRVNLMDRRVLRPHRGVAVQYRRVCARHRGVYALGPLQLRGADPTGLFPFATEIPEISRLLVYPQAAGLQFFPLLGDGTLTRTGEEILPEPGDSVEFRGVREWRASDGRRGVHWRTTARLGRLMAKEFDQDVITEVTIVLDLRRMALTGLGDHSTLEYAVRAASSTAQTAVEKQHLVQLFGLGGKERVHVPFGAGGRHLTQILDSLTLIRAEGDGDYVAEFDAVVPTLRRGATLLLIISAAAFDWPRMEPMLRALEIDGVRVVAVVLDDRSLLALFKEQDRVHREGPDLEALIYGLRDLGAEIFTIAAREDVRRRLETPL